VFVHKPKYNAGAQLTALPLLFVTAGLRIPVVIPSDLNTA
jgi:hypothetical protein